MALRPLESLDKLIIKEYTTSAIVRNGFAVMVSAVAADGEVSTISETADANDIPIGVALRYGASGAKIRVALYGGSGIVPMLVGTGGATCGAQVGFVSDGMTDINFQVASGATWTPSQLYGIAMQTGVAGDLVGVNVGTAGPCWLRST